MNNYLFEEIQWLARLLWLRVLLIAEAAFIWYLAFSQFFFKKPLGSDPATDTEMLVIWILAGVIIPGLLLTARLRTRICTDGVRLRYFPFHIRGVHIPWTNIAAHEAVTYRPLKEYGGWGIRWTTQGKAYNAFGNQGVRVHLKNGKHILIGSQRPDELAAAIDTGRKTS